MDNYEIYTGVADFYVYFFEKGLDILKDKENFHLYVQINLLEQIMLNSLEN